MGSGLGWRRVEEDDEEEEELEVDATGRRRFGMEAGEMARALPFPLSRVEVEGDADDEEVERRAWRFGRAKEVEDEARGKEGRFSCEEGDPPDAPPLSWCSSSVDEPRLSLGFFRTGARAVAGEREGRGWLILGEGSGRSGRPTSGETVLDEEGEAKFED